jgi:mitochondrial import receptor subunit TOM40
MATPYTTTDKSAVSTPINHNAPPAVSAYVDALTNVFRPVTAPIANTYQRFHNYKESWGLTQPGTAENLTKEVKRE